MTPLLLLLQTGATGSESPLVLPAAPGEAESLSAAFDLDTATDQVESSLVDVWNAFLGYVPAILAGLGVLVAVALVNLLARSLLSRLLARTKLRRSLRELAERLSYVALWLFGLLLAAMVVFPGLTPTKALSGLGIASVAIGFAFKDIFENFFAGILILWRFPFDNGDTIRCQDLMGRVEEITVRNTMIRRPDGELIVVPNSTLFTNPVDVLTDRPARRMELTCGVDYTADVAHAVDVIRAAVEACETPTHQLGLEVLPKGFGSSSIDIDVLWWSDPRPLQARRSRAEVVTAVKRALDEAGVSIPFPHRTLTFKEPLRVERSADPASAPGERGEDS